MTTNFDGPVVTQGKEELAVDLADGSTAAVATFVLATDQTVTNSATRVNASSPLVFTAAADSKYVAEYDLFVTGSTDADFKVGPVLSTGTTVIGAAGDGITLDGTFVAAATTVTIPTAGTTAVHARVVATFTTDEAGTCGISWAQASATPAETTTLKAGSTLRLAKVA